MSRYNRCIFVGRLTRDAELRHTQSGKTVITFSLAVNGFRKDDDAMFIECTAWERTAELVSQYCGKGSQVLVEGELRLEKWEGKDGTKRQAHKLNVLAVQFLDPKGGRDSEPETHSEPDPDLPF